MYVWAWNPFLQPPLYCSLVRQCKVSASAVVISLLKTLPRFVPKKVKDNKRKAMFAAILSPGPGVVLALLSFSLQRKHTLIQTIWETMCKCQNIALSCFVTLSCVRLSELGQFTIENILKDFLLMGWNSVTQWEAEFLSIARLQTIIYMDIMWIYLSVFSLCLLLWTFYFELIAYIMLRLKGFSLSRMWL